jgi:methionine sulfoxide reductase heme-binding subunit
MLNVRFFLFAAATLPILWLVNGAVTDGLGANPIERIVRFSGDWALRFLLLTLAVTPLRIIFKKPEIVRYRRMLGLFTYFYASMHILGYVVLDQFFHWHSIWADVIKRPYITVGFSTFIMLTLLAITSSKGWRRRLGSNWKPLHRLIYPAAILASIHFFMMIKADWRSSAYHGAILTILLGFRLLKYWQKSSF